MKSRVLSICFALLCAVISTEASAAVPFEVICDGGGVRMPPVYVYKTKNGQFLRMDVRQLPDGRYQSTRAVMPRGHVEELCAKQIPVSSMPPPDDIDTAVGPKIGVQSYVPSSFSIVGYTFPGFFSMVVGNFWVPASMPSSDNAHLTAFDLTTSDFVSATNGAHFVHMLTASSNSNIDTDYNGKGMIFGPYGGWCSGSPAYSGTYGSISETFFYPWVGPGPGTSGWYGNPSRSKVWAGYNPSNDSFGTVDAPGHTCIAQPTSGTISFLVGANRWQQSVYYTRISPWLPWTQTPTVDSYTSNFATGFAGVTFFVAAGGAPGNWTLSFSNVSSWTQP
ncbi:MAG: hypothetical protein JNL19_12305 [Burkholderiales bacterium]|nr:hypothetical protein [Burkholderiales bacterium]